MISNERRRNNYKRLRNAGFSAKEATRFKDHNDDRIEKLISTKLENDNRIKQVLKNGKDC